FDDRQVRRFGGKLNEVGEFLELQPEGTAEKFAMRGIQCAIAEPVIRALKSNDAIFSASQHGCLQRRLHRLEPGIAEDGFGLDFGFWILAFGWSAPSLEGNPAQLAGESGFSGMRMDSAHR